MINEGMINDIIEKRKEAENLKNKIVQNEAEYKAAVQRLFSTEDGMYFYKYLYSFCAMDRYEAAGNTVKMIEDNGRRSVFIEAIAKYLDKPT